MSVLEAPRDLGVSGTQRDSPRLEMNNMGIRRPDVVMGENDCFSGCAIGAAFVR